MKNLTLTLALAAAALIMSSAAWANWNQELKISVSIKAEKFQPGTTFKFDCGVRNAGNQIITNTPNVPWGMTAGADGTLNVNNHIMNVYVNAADVALVKSWVCTVSAAPPNSMNYVPVNLGATTKLEGPI